MLIYTCVSGCMFVCVQLTSKRLKRLGPNFVWDLTSTQGTRDVIRRLCNKDRHQGPKGICVIGIEI